MSSKECRRCGETLDLELFVKDRRRRDGHGSYCRSCHAENQRDHREFNPESARRARERHRVRTNYGVEVETWEATLDAATECALCGNPFRGNNKKCWDHDHRTGEFRGVLCNHCNMGLGHFRDDVERLSSAIDYLQESGRAS